VCLFVVCIGVLAVGKAFVPARDGPAEKRLLPDGIWRIRYDRKLDGKLSDDEPIAGRWQFTVINNQITGISAKPEERKLNRSSGEIVPGKPPIVFWRMDSLGVKGYVWFSCGRLVEEGKIVGTWYDTNGASGDFEFVFERP